MKFISVLIVATYLFIAAASPTPFTLPVDVLDTTSLEQRYKNYKCTNDVSNKILEGHEAGKIWNKYKRDVQVMTDDLTRCLSMAQPKPSEVCFNEIASKISIVMKQFFREVAAKHGNEYLSEIVIQVTMICFDTN